MDLKSDASSQMSEEDLLNKRKNERFAYILGILTQFLWAINIVQIKTIRKYYPNEYTDNGVLFWRMLPVTIIGYIICKFNNIHIQTFSELKHLNWFLLRNAFTYIFIIAWIKMYSYFRVSTISVIGGTTPIIIIIFSVCLIGEKFYIRYLIGVLICILGSSIIIFNDRNPESKVQILNDNLFIGICLAISYVILLALSFIGSKVLTKEGMNIHLQTFYFSLFNVVPSLFIGIIIGELKLQNIIYILYVCSNGIIFYGAN